MITNPVIRNSLLNINVSNEDVFSSREHMYHDYTMNLYAPYAEFIDHANTNKVWSDPKINIDFLQADVSEELHE